MPSVLVCPASDATSLTFGGSLGEDCLLSSVSVPAPSLMASMASSFKWVDSQWLWFELRRSSGPGVLVVDCRNLEDYARSRIRGSVHLSLPSLLLRRLAAGKLPVENAIPCGVARDTFLSACNAGRLLVICGKPCRATDLNDDDDPADDDQRLGAVASILLKRLAQEGHEVVVLGGSVDGFRDEYPEWCEAVGDPTEAADGAAAGHSKEWPGDSEPAVVGLQALRLTPSYVQTPDSGFPLSKKTRFAGARARVGAGGCNKPKKTPATLKPPRRFGVGSVDSLPDTTEEEDCGEEAEEDDFDTEHLDSSLGSADSGSESGTMSTGGGYTDGPRVAKGFPVQILPYLYLGNAQNAEDEAALRQHSIQYILNVTPDLPNVFERRDSLDNGDKSVDGDDGTQEKKIPRLHIKYKKIPIDDHWSQDLGGFFPEAIQFIEEARTQGVGVLVHCLAGVSRSVTFTLAYLMFKLHLSLNDAFDFVRRRKGNIAPNFTFLGQLLDFERDQLPELRRKHLELVAATEGGQLMEEDLAEVDDGGKSMVLPRVRVLPGSCNEDDLAVAVDAVAGQSASAENDKRQDEGVVGGGGGQQSAAAAAPFSATSPDSGIDFER